jgi:hypothetical protein
METNTATGYAYTPHMRNKHDATVTVEHMPCTRDVFLTIRVNGKKLPDIWLTEKQWLALQRKD